MPAHIYAHSTCLPSHVQTGDAGRPEFRTDDYYALFPRVNPSVARVLGSHSCPHERDPQGRHIAHHRFRARRLPGGLHPATCDSAALFRTRAQALARSV